MLLPGIMDIGGFDELQKSTGWTDCHAETRDGKSHAKASGTVWELCVLVNLWWISCTFGTPGPSFRHSRSHQCICPLYEDDGPGSC